MSLDQATLEDIALELDNLADTDNSRALRGAAGLVRSAMRKDAACEAKWIDKHWTDLSLDGAA